TPELSLRGGGTDHPRRSSVGSLLHDADLRDLAALFEGVHPPRDPPRALYRSLDGSARPLFERRRCARPHASPSGAGSRPMSKAFAYAMGRIGWALIVVLGISCLSFVVTEWLPGDTALMLAGPQANQKDLEHVRAVYGLDRPMGDRFFRYWHRLIH